MPKPRPVPSYRYHKATGQAVVVLRGRSFYLGKFGSPESKTEYRRVIAEYLASGNQPPPPGDATSGSPATPGLSVDDLILRYWRFAEGHYVRDGKPARELLNIKDALRHLRPLYGATPAARFGPLSLKTVRRSMIDAGLCRNTINFRVGKIRRMFRWGVENELVAPAVYQGLMAVSGLGRGKGGARETKPVRPVPIETVEATLPHLPAPVAGLVRLQLLTGMRPGEAVAIRAGEIDRSEEVWAYRPSRHKADGTGRVRTILIGPKAQEVLGPFLERAAPDEPLFSPRAAVEARNEARRRARRTPMTPSQLARRPKARPERPPGSSYSKNAYRTAIWRACDRAFPHPTLASIERKDLTDDQRAELRAWRKANRWHPNRLRHTAATEIRAQFGLEASQAVLGHAKADVTQVYAERDLARAREVIRRVG